MKRPVAFCFFACLLLSCTVSARSEESCLEAETSPPATILLQSKVQLHLGSTRSHRSDSFVGDESYCDTETNEKIIFVNSFYPGTIRALNGSLLPDCPVTCKISTSSSALEFADAVVWNARWMDPVHDVPRTKKKCQRWVFSFYAESAIYIGQRVNYSASAAFGDNIDWTMTYRPDSDFFQPMQRLHPHESAHADTASLATAPFAVSKPKLLLWLSSNCDGAQGKHPRQMYFQALKHHLPEERVDTFGSCGQEMPCPRLKQAMEEPNECEERFFGQYKFYAALENSRCTGYITEKLARAYRFGMVPVVVGGGSRADYEAIAPGDSFIHADDFPSTQALASRLLELDQNDTAYRAFFDWRSSVYLWPKLKNDVQPFCELCQELHKPRRNQKPSFGNVLRWWYDGSCHAEPYPSRLFD